MKKLQLKKRRKSNAKHVTDSRITNETVAEHRERILAGGKKFKYPHQYLRHRLVINAVIIGLVAITIAVAVGWWQLYHAQNTSDFMYRVTRAIPVPVATVDGRQVQYSDYLMRYRSQELYQRTQGQLGLTAEDGKRQLDFYKRKVLDGLELDVYAAKRAEDANVSVSSKDIDAFVDEDRNTSTGRISKEVYDASAMSTLGYSVDEYRHFIGQSLLREKVAYAVDSDAKRIADVVKLELQANKDFEAVVKKLQAQNVKIEFGASGLVSSANKDGGLTRAALNLKDSEISAPIQSKRVEDYGFYFIQKLSSNEKQVSYQFIRVPLSKFSQEFESIKKAGKIKEHIPLQAIDQQTQ